MTTNQTTTGTTSEHLRSVPGDARAKASAATSKAGTAVRRNPKSTAAGVLALAGAAVAAVFLGRRRAAAKSRGRRRFAALRHR
jgi:hypothetical protein